MIADQLAAAIQADFLARVESVRGYLNFFIDRAIYAERVLAAAEAQGDRYGSDNSGAGKCVVLDYSSINIAKRFHIGHLSTTMIGNALYKLYKFFGWKAVGVNHLGDWGTQFGKMIAAYKKWGDRETVERGGVDEMVKLYVRFHKEAENDPALEDEGRAWFKKIEDGDEEALSIFNWFKEVTLKDAQKTYELLGVTFDSYAGESFYNDKMGPVVEELKEKGLLKEDKGAMIVDLEPYGMPPALILRSDGATLYLTRDLAAAKYRKDTYNFDKSLYVVAYQQDLHFKQLFKVLELMGYTWAKDCEHVAFGMVSYEGQTLSTREGRVVYLDDLLHQAIQKARDIIEEKSPALENKDEIARQIGVGAVVFFVLYNNRIKDIDFWWDRALNFEGETGPYVMYTHARACSVLRKPEAQAAEGAKPDFSALADPGGAGSGAPHRAVPAHPQKRPRALRALDDHALFRRPCPGVQQVLLRAPHPRRGHGRARGAAAAHPREQKRHPRGPLAHRPGRAGADVRRKNSAPGENTSPGAHRALTKPATAKIALIYKKSEAIFASCVSCTCILRSLTSMYRKTNFYYLEERI